VDTVVLSQADGVPQVLLRRRGNAPYKGCWELTGGMVCFLETIERAVKRIIGYDFGRNVVSMAQLPGVMQHLHEIRNENRFHSVSLAYRVVLDSFDIGGSQEARWFALDTLPKRMQPVQGKYLHQAVANGWLAI